MVEAIMFIVFSIILALGAAFMELIEKMMKRDRSALMRIGSKKVRYKRPTYVRYEELRKRA